MSQNIKPQQFKGFKGLMQILSLVRIHLKLSYTIHKVQGLTVLNSTRVSLTWIKQTFSARQIYVALSHSSSSPNILS